MGPVGGLRPGVDRAKLAFSVLTPALVCSGPDWRQAPSPGGVGKSGVGAALRDELNWSERGGGDQDGGLGFGRAVRGRCACLWIESAGRRTLERNVTLLSLAKIFLFLSRLIATFPWLPKFPT